MTNDQWASNLCQQTLRPSPIKRKAGVVALVAFGCFLCCGATAPDGCQEPPQPSTHYGAIVGGIAAGVGVATFVLIDVHHSNHNLKGCVFNGPNGMEVQTSDNKNYALEGVTPDIKVGDLVQLHGSRIKKTGDSKGDQVFMVQTLNRDRGPCHVVAENAPPLSSPNSPM